MSVTEILENNIIKFLSQLNRNNENNNINDLIIIIETLPSYLSEYIAILKNIGGDKGGVMAKLQNKINDYKKLIRDKNLSYN